MELATQASERWHDAALQFCPLTSSRFGHLAIEHRSCWCIADQIAVGDKKQGRRHEADDGEFEKARKRPIRNPNLHEVRMFRKSNAARKRNVAAKFAAVPSVRTQALWSCNSVPFRTMRPPII